MNSKLSLMTWRLNPPLFFVFFYFLLPHVQKQLASCHTCPCVIMIGGKRLLPRKNKRVLRKRDAFFTSLYDGSCWFENHNNWILWLQMKDNKNSRNYYSSRWWNWSDIVTGWLTFPQILTGALPCELAASPYHKI